MAGRLEGEFRFGAHGPRPDRRREDAPALRVVIVADLRGRAGRGGEDPGLPVAPRHLVAVDVDNFGEVLTRFEPRLELHLGGPESPEVPIVFRGLEDFHPDALYRGLAPFGSLRDIRRRPANVAVTFLQRVAAHGVHNSHIGHSVPA